MKRPGILRSVLGLMSHESVSIRVATIWVIINLTWPDDKSTLGVHDRVLLFRNLGVEDRLQSLTADQDLDVRDRVKTALHHFSLDQQQHGHSGIGLQDPSGQGNGRHGSTARYAAHGSLGQEDGFSNPSLDSAQALSGPGSTGHERR